MNKEFYPLCVAHAVPRHSGVRFVHFDALYDIDSHTEEIWALLEACNGLEPVDTVVKTALKAVSGSSEVTLRGIIDDLREIGVLVDSRQAYKHFHRLSTNPLVYSRKLSYEEIEKLAQQSRASVKTGEVLRLKSVNSKLAKLQRSRKSCRNFVPNKLSIRELAAVMNAGYSPQDHATPSAGGIYPLRLFVVVADGCTEIPAGYYEYNPKQSELVRYCDKVDQEQLRYAFDNNELVYNAPAVVIIAGDLERQSDKYSNRGYRYSLIEAGHAAQNIVLAATEQGLASLEYGGFLDEVLAKEICVDKDGLLPLITVAIGHEANVDMPDSAELLRTLDTELVGRGKPVRYVKMNFGGQPYKGESFFGATALYRPGPDQDAKRTYRSRFASGTAATSQLAQVKAIAEGFERYVSGQIRVDRVERAKDLETPWLNPNTVAPWSTEQFSQNPWLKPFSSDTSWEWVAGYEPSSRQEVHVPVDLVFYPIKSERFGRKLCYEATSSGVAAYTNHEEAIKRGLLELLERDAVMRNWLSRETPRLIRKDLLPIHWQRRVEFWQSKNKSVYIADLSHDGVVILNVLITGESYPSFSNGSAATISSFEDALGKAFQEAELGLFHAMNSGKQKMPNQQDITSPMDHARYYFYPENIESISWMWQGEEVSKPPTPSATYDDLICRLNPVVVDLSQNAPLCVVRVLCDKLVPINFGFQTEHYLHQAVKSGLEFGDLRIPHYFA